MPANADRQTTNESQNEGASQTASESIPIPKPQEQGPGKSGQPVGHRRLLHRVPVEARAQPHENRCRESHWFAEVAPEQRLHENEGGEAVEKRPEGNGLPMKEAVPAQIDFEPAPRRHAAEELAQPEERRPENRRSYRKDVLPVSGAGGCFDAGTLQHAVLSVFVLEMDVEVFPERLHIGVVEVAVADHAATCCVEVIDAGKHEEDERQLVAVFPPAGTIEADPEPGEE